MLLWGGGRREGEKKCWQNKENNGSYRRVFSKSHDKNSFDKKPIISSK